ncbi:unnamed protein product [Ectocarpus sp. 4 AP-2014]
MGSGGHNSRLSLTRHTTKCTAGNEGRQAVKKYTHRLQHCCCMYQRELTFRCYVSTAVRHRPLSSRNMPCVAFPFFRGTPATATFYIHQLSSTNAISNIDVHLLSNDVLYASHLLSGPAQIFSRTFSARNQRNRNKWCCGHLCCNLSNRRTNDRNDVVTRRQATVFRL